MTSGFAPSIRHTDRGSPESAVMTAGNRQQADRIPAAIAEQAVAWFVRRDAGPLAEDEARSFEDWLQAAPVHAAAYRMVEGNWSALGNVDPLTRRRLARDAFSRRSRHGLRAGLALAACLLLAVGLWWSGLPSLWTADHRTALGERRSVTLADGSQVDLNTDTAFNVSSDGGQRRIRLLRGEAIFHVAPNPAQPFVVAAGDGTVTALGTVFTVRRSEADVQVAAIEHRIEVAVSGQSRVLVPGEGIVYGAAGLGGIHPVDPHLATSWRDGKLVFEQRPLGEVVAELTRYRHGMLYLRGDSLAGRMVSGVVDLNDGDAAIETIARSLGLNVQRYGGLLTVLSAR